MSNGKEETELNEVETEETIREFKIKKLIKSLENARGNGTSMISLIIPAGGQISRVQKMLTEEFGTASCIKSRVTQQSVLGAIVSTQQRLKLYPRVPPNGLVIYSGTVVDERREKRVTYDFEPFKPINDSLYLCDNRFHTEPLKYLHQDEKTYGFIIVDGSGALFATICGNVREIITKFTVDLPKKHGRGGQSALRFARLRVEKRRNWLRKVAETANQVFITGEKVNVHFLIFAGLADFKTELSQTDLLDPRIRTKVAKLVDISYGLENGLNQAIELSRDVMQSLKYVKEYQTVAKFFEEIAKDQGGACYGVKDTMYCLEAGAIKTLIIYEDLDVTRFTLRNPVTEAEKVLCLSKDDEKKQGAFKEDGVDLEVVDSVPFVEYLADNYKKYGATLEFVSQMTPEGYQFCRGFGGMGGILKYKLDTESFAEEDLGGYDSDDDLEKYF